MQRAGHAARERVNALASARRNGRRRPPVAATHAREFQRRGGRRRSFDRLHDAARRAAVSPGLLAHRARRDQLPAILRRQRSRRPCAWKTRGVRRRARAAPRSGRSSASSPASASIIPMACSIRPAISRVCAAPSGQRLGDDDVYVVAEKVLARDERLRTDWEVHGHHRLQRAGGTSTACSCIRRGWSNLRRVYKRLARFQAQRPPTRRTTARS